MKWKEVWLVVLEDLTWNWEPTLINAFSSFEGAIKCFNFFARNELKYANYDEDLSLYNDLNIKDELVYQENEYLWIQDSCNLYIEKETIDSFNP